MTEAVQHLLHQCDPLVGSSLMKDHQASAFRDLLDAKSTFSIRC